MVAHIAEREVTMACFVPGYVEKELCEEVTQAVQTALEQANTPTSEAVKFELKGKLAGMVIVIPTEGVASDVRSSKGAIDSSSVDYCAMVYEVDGKWRKHWFHPAGLDDPSRKMSLPEGIKPQSGSLQDDEKSTTLEQRMEDKFVSFHGRSTLPMLFHIMLYRESRFTPFPGRISQRYWEDSAELMKADTEPKRKDVLRPPWDTDELQRTATLSFDLRKSTFCMEHADKHKKFGDWLDQMVEILTGVCHLHGGVFDKFTGDGALIHFLQKEFVVVYENKDPVEAAMDCAVDMHRAIGIHLERLREFLRFDCQLLGAGIAIDISDTYWALDHRDNPITVGRGVVGACRLCDRTPAGKIHMTNIAYRALTPEILNKLPHPRVVPLESKEFNKEMEITVWEFTMPSDPPELELGSRDTIANLCKWVCDRPPGHTTMFPPTT
jgi:class 3 adenylate cyclase